MVCLCVYRKIVILLRNCFLFLLCLLKINETTGTIKLKGKTKANIGFR